MNLFPIGEIASETNTGTIDGLSYSMFEPNAGTMSQPVYNNLITLFQNQSRQTRKKAEPFLSIIYTYENILQREYQQIEHFVDYVDDALTSFYTIDWSRGRKPSEITTTGEGSPPEKKWMIHLDNTRLFSTIPNKKASHIFIWDGSSWRLDVVEDIVTTPATYVLIDVPSTALGGTLTLGDAQTKGIVYPAYCVYFAPAALSTFESTVYIDEDLTDSKDGGWMKSGTITFNSKYSAI
jgi:hypothetical protein